MSHLWRHAALTQLPGVGLPVVLMHESPLPTLSRPLDWNLSGVDALRLLRGDAHPVALLGAWAGGSDIIAANPVRVTCDPVAFTAEEPPSPAAASPAAASPA